MPLLEDKQLIIVGAGGHAKVVIEAARAAGFTPAAVLDPHPPGPDVLDVPVLGGDDMAEALLEQGYSAAFVAIGNNAARRRIGRRLREAGLALPSIVHPTAIVSPSARVGEGVLVMPGAVINAMAEIGDLAIVNTGAIVEHDCRIGAAAHVAPRSVLGGTCTLEDEVFFGIGSTARPGSWVGARSIVGAGSVVVGRIDPEVTVVGAPARPRHSAT